MVTPTSFAPALESLFDGLIPDRYHSSMNSKSYRLHRIVTLVMLALLFGLKSFAAPPSELLRDAYVNLALAKHDYEGHRVKAMKRVEEAGKILGFAFRGSEKGREHQGESDAQLHEARHLLEQARTQMEEKDRLRIATKLDDAIKEIDVALKTK